MESAGATFSTRTPLAPLPRAPAAQPERRGAAAVQGEVGQEVARGTTAPSGVDLPLPVDVFLDPVVQLAALCPICALAALKPEAALSALSPNLAVFNPALNPRAALLNFALSFQVQRFDRQARLGLRAATTTWRMTDQVLRLQGRAVGKSWGRF